MRKQPEPRSARTGPPAGRHAEPTLRGRRGPGWPGSPSSCLLAPTGTHWHRQRPGAWHRHRHASTRLIPARPPASPSAALPSTGPRLARWHGRVGAPPPAPPEGLPQPGSGSRPSLPADLWPGCLNWLYFSELEGSAWLCQTPAGLLRHAAPGLQSRRCLPEHVPQPALSWQEPALAPRPDFPNPWWRLTCSRNISRRFGSVNSSGTGESRGPPASAPKQGLQLLGSSKPTQGGGLPWGGSSEPPSPPLLQGCKLRGRGGGGGRWGAFS